MKWLISFLLTLAAGVGFTLFTQYDPGFILIGWGQWTLESSLALFILLLLATVMVLWLSFSFLIWLIRLPFRLWTVSPQQQRKANQNLLNGVLALLAQDWRNAEKLLTKQAACSDIASLHYIVAAYVALQNDKKEKYTAYLAAAEDHLTQHHNAAALIHAHFALLRGEADVAVQRLKLAHIHSPHDRDVLRTLAHACVAATDWHTLKEILPLLKKHKVFSKVELQAFEQQSRGASLLLEQD